MVERLRRAHTPQPRLDPVAFVTIQTLGSIVFSVTETNTKRGRRLRGASVTFHLMASATSGNIATIRLRTRCVTPEAVCMRIKPCRNRKRHSTPHRPVTTVATQAAEVLVPCVLETHSKTGKPRKCLNCPRLRVSVTDCANLMSRVCKLLRMTSCTRHVAFTSRHRRARLTRLSSMAQEAGQSRMIRVIVPEF